MMDRGSCMGGWCALRDKCAEHRPGVIEFERPRERRCSAGGREFFVHRADAARADAAEREQAVAEGEA